MMIRRTHRRLLTLASLFILVCSKAQATPSTHVWSPSTDLQTHGTAHLTADAYVPSEHDAAGARPDTVTNFGLEGGYWPIKDTFGVEFGFDVFNGYGELDDYPLYFNVKGGVLEKAFFENSPALAVGGYNFGTKPNKTDVNSYYVEAAQTFTVRDFSLGRVSFGWFWGNSDLLLDAQGNSDTNGMILSWERHGKSRCAAAGASRCRLVNSTFARLFHAQSRQRVLIRMSGLRQILLLLILPHGISGLRAEFSVDAYFRICLLIQLGL